MSSPAILAGKRLLLGVSGSVAAYKAVDLASKLTQGGAEVSVILSESAQRFVTALAFQAVTGRAVHTDMWELGSDGRGHIAHIELGENADLCLIAPGSAQTIARLAAGFADNLLSLTALSLRCPLLIAPAMDGGMYEHPATQANLATLRARGVQIIAPAVGRMASGLRGQGRLPETAALVGEIRRALGRQSGALRGRRLLVSAGGTREALDPVRYLGNRSSGRQGYAIAQAALDAGAEVTLISTVEGRDASVGAEVIRVETAAEMRAETLTHLAGVDALIMAAAVADFRPAAAASQKIKRGTLETLALPLERAADALAAVAERREQGSGPAVVVGFAAESEDLRRHAAEKLVAKRLDLLLANDITEADAGFAVETNRITLFAKDGTVEEWPLLHKEAVAQRLMAWIATLLAAGDSTAEE
ncbi:MAG: bifunctional phosphopantothenoylcysteine decarboxylase/phosphopantothenate--cysteine ligase CoaBC [Chloroflexi bacterium]|nr:bifunctional phosphopantothenoylcysteine decarboxylase/phosphopantothenate--cysteine ligase CoaBC [Chloroflexota bacterium]